MATADAGIAVVDKPSGVTSHGVVGRLRREFGTRKVGHAGTLDPMATGVLVVGVNRATRLLGHLALHDKEYLATIRLGAATVTDDAEGDVTSTASTCHLTEEDVRTAMVPLTGDIEQTPSAVSAIKVEGKRAYALVRAGEEVELKARPVTVSRFELLASRRTDDGFFDVDVHVECTSGTYVRALARDVGRALGVGGHLTALRRTRVGPFTLDDVEDPTALLSMGEVARRCFTVDELSAAEATDVRYGKPLKRSVTASPTALLAPDGDLLALYRPTDEGARAVCVLVEPPQPKENSGE